GDGGAEPDGSRPPAQCHPGRPGPPVPAGRGRQPHPLATPLQQRPPGAALQPGATPPQLGPRGRADRRAPGRAESRRSEGGRAVNSYLVYRASFYLMLTVATLALSSEAVGSRFAFLYPLGVAVAGFVAFLTVDRQSRWALPRPLANVLGLLTVAALWF